MKAHKAAIKKIEKARTEALQECDDEKKRRQKAELELDKVQNMQKDTRVKLVKFRVTPGAALRQT